MSPKSQLTSETINYSRRSKNESALSNNKNLRYSSLKSSEMTPNSKEILKINSKIEKTVKSKDFNKNSFKF